MQQLEVSFFNFVDKVSSLVVPRQKKQKPAEYCSVPKKAYRNWISVILGRSGQVTSVVRFADPRHRIQRCLTLYHYEGRGWHFSASINFIQTGITTISLSRAYAAIHHHGVLLEPTQLPPLVCLPLPRFQPFIANTHLAPASPTKRLS